MVQRISYSMSFGGDVTGADVSNLNDIDKPLGFSYDYKREKYADWDDGRITAPLPATGLEVWSEETKKPDEPVLLGGIGTLDFKAEIGLPQQATPPSNVKLSEDFADYTSTYEIKNNVLTVTRLLTIKKPTVPVEEWEKYKTFAKAISADRNSWIQFGEAHSDATPATPSNPEADRYFKEGYDALQRHDLTGASESFQRVLDIDPSYPAAHANIGVVYIAGGNVDAGIRELKKEEELNPKLAFSYETLARVYTYKHDTGAAIDQLQKLLAMDPKNRDAALTLGQLLGSEKKYPEALAVLQKASELAPDSNTVKYELGYAYIRNGDKDKGLAILQEALKNDQEHDRDTLSLNNVAYSLIEMDTGMNVAQQYAEKSLQQQEAESLKATTDREGFAATSALDAVWDTVGWVYFKQGQYEKALPYVRAAWILGQHGEVGDHLGQIYGKLGKKQEAARTFQLAFAANRLGPRTPYVTKLNDGIKDHYQEATGKPFSEPEFFPTKSSQHGTRIGESPDEELSRMREVKLTSTSHPSATGKFTVVFSPGKVDEVKQIDGDESLKSLDEPIKTAKFEIEFPDATQVKLRRRGIVTCGTQGCDMVLLPVDDQSLFAEQ